jgi:hypothetical protein
LAREGNRQIVQNLYRFWLFGEGTAEGSLRGSVVALLKSLGALYERGLQILRNRMNRSRKRD